MSLDKAKRGGTVRKLACGRQKGYWFKANLGYITLSQTKQTPSLLWWSGVAGAVPGTTDGNSFYPWPIGAVSDGWAWQNEYSPLCAHIPQVGT